MIPNFELFGKTFSPYMLFALAGILITLWFSYSKAKKHALNEVSMLYTFLISAVGIFIGMHLLYGITMYEHIIYFFSHLDEITSFSVFIDRMAVIFGGSVFYGGLLGGLFVGMLCYKKMKLTPLYADIAACSIPLFHFFGRLGCFFTGCCYGIECDIGIVYHYHPDELVNGITRFPIQLVEALFNLVLFFVLLMLLKKGRRHGRLLSIYLLSYSVFRFFAEYLRGDSIRGFVGPFSTSQLISLLIVAGVIIYYIIKRRKKSLKHAV